ncbi:IS110 family transposase [Pseudomonas guariconensis]|uniref:IS110 family transposase n=1 Tax=Pseudomonas guariconensis TaxID=1288410 RepID=UPI0018A8B195|nr:IS110 family transposase [Pseudomonas guariconensis]MBF8743995.1 IS110 family transposase [Pseudomonas guariconensis]MBF8753532.1 IS110 family transposase [Pseudomonas guariconensis]
MSAFVGVDVAKKSFDIATPLGNGKFRTKAKLVNGQAGFQQFEDWLKRHAEPGAWIVMEATGTYHEALADFLHAKGYRICIANPAVIAAFADVELRRVKTDKADAKTISAYAQQREDSLRLWQPEPPAQRRLRALVRRLDDLKEILQMEKNRLDVAPAAVQGSIRSVMEHVELEIEETRKAIDQTIDDDPDLRQRRKLIVSIDGLGETTAALILAELGDPLKFAGPSAIVAFAGLNPMIHQSGEQVGQSTISRTGSTRLRSGMYMAGITAMKWNPVVKALAERLTMRHKAYKQIVCASMRKLLHLVYGVVKSGKPFDPQIALAA